MFGRVKSLDAILATAEKKSLHRSLGAFQLTMLGIGAIIGTGIFVLTAEAAQKAGPGMMISFIIAGAVCAVAALWAAFVFIVTATLSFPDWTIATPIAAVGALVIWSFGRVARHFLTRR